jgi:glycosyltransferase involved in cell wall biosynthesis
MLLFGFIGLSLLITTAVAVYNFLTAPVLRPREGSLSAQPLVSVLIPARNEQNNIDACLQAIMQQTYGFIEILVYNDQSTDQTQSILERWQREQAGIKVLQGQSPPQGWVPKNWACHCLSEQAQGDYLLFVDADVRLSPWAVASALDHMLVDGLQALSCFPTQEIQGVSTQLVTPLMNWLLLNFLPLRQVAASSNRAFVAANGQFLMMVRSAYTEEATHKGQRNKIVEDMEIARALKNRGHKIMTLLGGNGVRCRMYRTFAEALAGFTKNFYQGFRVSAPVFALMLAFFSLIYVGPLIGLFFDQRYVLLAVLVGLSRALIAYRSQQSVWLNVLLHPVQMLLMVYVGCQGMLRSQGAGFEWKGRRVRL